MSRLQWARSYAKLIGALESPSRGVFLLTDLGQGVAEPSPSPRPSNGCGSSTGNSAAAETGHGPGQRTRPTR